jgi:hypothetical protein
MNRTFRSAAGVLLLLLPACASSPEPEGKGGPGAGGGAPASPDEDAAALLRARQEWEKRIAESEKVARQRAELLPGLLERFEREEPSAWKEAEAALKLLESREKGFVYDRVLEILPAAMRPGAQGEAARAEMARIGKIVRLSARLESSPPPEWPSVCGELQALGSEGTDAAAVRLILKLRTQDPEVLLPAQERLVALGKGAVRHLVLALTVPGVAEQVKARCADALAAIGPAALPALLPLLAPGARGPSKFAAARVLGRMGHPAALEALEKAERAEEDPLVRCALLDALAAVGGPAAVRAAVRALSDRDLSVVKFGARALGRLKAREAAADLVRALERARDEGADDVRDEAAAALRAATGIRAGADPAEWRRRLGMGDE